MNDRIGMMNKNTDGEYMKIIKYDSYNHVFVLFLKTGNIIKTDYRHFKEGGIKDKMSKNIYNVAYLGIGEYNTSKNKKEYASWFNMLIRCYSEHFQYKENYKNCVICEDWLCFQNFCKWYNSNIWADLKKTQVDKDILIKGNKIYSPETCVLVDQRLNSLFTKSNKIRGELPIGVIYKKQTKRFIANGNVGQTSKNSFIKYCDTKEDAFNIYKQSKEKYIKEIADEYKSKYPNFPQKLYDAMYNYEVEITD